MSTETITPTKPGPEVAPNPTPTALEPPIPVRVPDLILPDGPTCVLRDRDDEELSTAVQPAPARPQTTPPSVTVLPAAMALAAIAALAISFAPWLTPAVTVTVSVMSTAYLTLRVCQRSVRKALDGLDDIAQIAAATPDFHEANARIELAMETREEILRESTLKEVEKLRIFFEALLEKHVFRIHRDLREKEAELDELKRTVLEGRSLVPGVSGAALAPEPVDVEEAPAAPVPTIPVLEIPLGLEPEEPPTSHQQCAELSELERIQGGHLKPSTSRVPVRDLLETVMEGFRQDATDQDVKITSRLGKTLSTLVTDPIMLTRVIEELLDNAVAYSKKNGTVNVSASVQGRKGQKKLRIRVKDSGCGIAKKNLDKIFAAFEQIDEGRNSGSSTGLGLPIAREYARLLGGDVFVESESKKGSTFIIELPT